MDYLSLLDTSEYRTYHLSIARALGSIHAAIFLGEIIQRHRYHKENKDNFLIIDGDEYFYYTADKCTERTAMTEREQRTAISILERHGLISKKVKGVPAKRYFRVHEHAVLDLLGFSKNDSSFDETPNWFRRNAKLVSTKRQSPIYKEHQEEEHKHMRACDPPKKSPPDRTPRGEAQTVMLSDDEYNRLVDRYGLKALDEMIETLADYMASTGKRYKDHAAALRNFFRREQKADSAQKACSTDTIAEHEAIARELEQTPMPQHVHVYALSKNLEIAVEGAGNNSVVIAYDDKQFKQKLDNQLRRWNIRKKFN